MRIVVGERISVGQGEDEDTGRVLSIDSPVQATVAWNSGVKTALPIKHVGWTDGDGTGRDGYNLADYFSAAGYLGPDVHGIEPIFEVWE